MPPGPKYSSEMIFLLTSFSLHQSMGATSSRCVLSNGVRNTPCVFGITHRKKSRKMLGFLRLHFSPCPLLNTVKSVKSGKFWKEKDKFFSAIFAVSRKLRPIPMAGIFGITTSTPSCLYWLVLGNLQLKKIPSPKHGGFPWAFTQKCSVLIRRWLFEVASR